MDIEKINHAITQKINDLCALQRESERGCDTVALDQSCVGRLSRMDAMQSQAMNQAAQRRRVTQIKRLEAALQRIDSNDYGDCENCDELISEGRLLLDPAAEFCVQCAEQFEQSK
jgi:DnaK suppressor protein